MLKQVNIVTCIENTVSNNTTIVVRLQIRCLETGSSVAASMFIFTGNLFTEPLPSNELFQLSGVMSQHQWLGWRVVKIVKKCMMGSSVVSTLTALTYEMEDSISFDVVCSENR
jgi:hypothetical protein